MAPILRRWVIVTVQLGSAFALLFVAYHGFFRLTGNVHSIAENEAYRSGQLSPSKLDETINKHGIKSIINLRGGNYDKGWYQQEVILARQKNIEHIDFALSAKREVTKEQAAELIEIMKAAPKPILLHCEHGADRTGIASALYIAAIKNGGEAAAARELSLRFGHLPYTLSGQDPMDKSFDNLKTSLKLFE